MEHQKEWPQIDAENADQTEENGLNFSLLSDLYIALILASFLSDLRSLRSSAASLCHTSATTTE
jgi:hypothetical protein